MYFKCILKSSPVLEVRLAI